MIGHLNSLYEHGSHVFWVCIAILAQKVTAIIQLLCNLLGILLSCCLFLIYIVIYISLCVTIGRLLITVCRLLITVCVHCVTWGFQTSCDLGSALLMRLRDWTSGGNARSSTINRRLPNSSVEQHALWDRWLDGY